MKMDIVNAFQLVTTNNTCTFSEKNEFIEILYKIVTKGRGYIATTCLTVNTVHKITFFLNIH